MYRALGLANRTDSFGSTGVRDATGQSGRFAGQQLEASASYWLMPKVAQLEVGYARLFKGRFLRVAPNAPDTGDTNYGYARSEEHTSELQSLMRTSYAVFCLKKKKT